MCPDRGIGQTTLSAIVGQTHTWGLHPHDHLHRQHCAMQGRLRAMGHFALAGLHSPSASLAVLVLGGLGGGLQTFLFDVALLLICVACLVAEILPL